VVEQPAQTKQAFAYLGQRIVDSCAARGRGRVPRPPAASGAPYFCQLGVLSNYELRIEVKASIILVLADPGPHGYHAESVARGKLASRDEALESIVWGED
jgi:hypothetical protein